jgi:hypothetical protein
MLVAINWGFGEGVFTLIYFDATILSAVLLRRHTIDHLA